MEDAMTPFEAAQLRTSALAENLARAEAVNKLVEDLMAEERACSVPISGSVGVAFESEQYTAAITTLKIVASMDAIMGISA